MKLIHIQIHIFYTNIQTTHKRQRVKKNVNTTWKPKPSCLFPCFSPSPPPVEVQFILQFIYTYIVSMHKRIPHPTPNDRGDLVGFLFFFNMGITLTHIEDNLQTQNKSKRDAKQKLVCPWCVILDFTKPLCHLQPFIPAHLFPMSSSSFKYLS